MRYDGQLLRDLPGVAARIREGERAHSPGAVCRAADDRDFALVQFDTHRIRVLDEHDELPNPSLRQFLCVG